MEGYTHNLCMSCYIHGTLTVESIFSIQQEVACTGYLEPIPLLHEKLTFQGDETLDQVASYTVESFFVKTPMVGCNDKEVCTLYTPASETDCGTAAVASVISIDTGNILSA